MTNKDGEAWSEYVIILIDTETSLPVYYPGYEAYVMRRELVDGQSEAYRKKNIGVIVGFLNYLIGRCLLCDVNVVVLAGYLKSIKTKQNGEMISYDYWKFSKRAVYTFLSNIHDMRPQFFNNLDTSTLISHNFYKDNNGFEKCINSYASLGVKAPPELPRKKNRVIPLPCILLLMEEAEKYDPEIVLGIALQSFGGLREGEVVNLSVEDIVIKWNIGTVYNIEVNINEEGYWSSNRINKTPVGYIKKKRSQAIYESFLNIMEDLYMKHMQRHEVRSQDTGVDMTANTSPLFFDENKHPMTVDTYTDRVRELFRNHFVDRLIQECIEQGTYDEQERLIQEYKKEFTGCHALRHFFTMYLLDVARLEEEDIRVLRGDKSLLSMEQYIHENHRYSDMFDRGMLAFQKGIVTR